MTNENKKAWISMIVPVIFLIFIIFLPYPESWGFVLRFSVTFIPFLVIQYYLSRFLKKKYPTNNDLRADIKIK